MTTEKPRRWVRTGELARTMAPVLGKDPVSLQREIRRYCESGKWPASRRGRVKLWHVDMLRLKAQFAEQDEDWFLDAFLYGVDGW